MDDNKPAASAAPTPTQNAAAPAPQGAPVVRDAANPATAPSGTRPIARGVVTNPSPVADPDAPVKEKVPAGLPQSTVDEMAAGRKALERNQPVARALEDARAAKDAGTTTTPETNPVDATQTLHQQGKV
jgi:hypothetical protein